MNPRNEILSDTNFWHRLEFGMALRSGRNEKIPRYWIDGFIPENARNTKEGIIVEGKVWIVDGKGPDPFSFEALVPQKLLQKRIKDFDCEVILFSPDQKILRFKVKPMKRDEYQASDATAYGRASS